MKNLFTQHPHSLGESYFVHFKFACVFGFKMMLGGFACLLHSIFPFLFPKTASNILISLMQEFVERTSRPDARVINLTDEIKRKVS
ncbi:MAG: hypothetical protein H0W64_09790 [Gammaproteobacteria bacterium]|nr:hypothetical protein [Gammaproteobacteria bacterium]